VFTALESRNRLVAVYGHKELAAETAGLFEERDVAHVQQIEAAVGKRRRLAAEKESLLIDTRAKTYEDGR
jgi:hypothetical protein